MSNEIHLEYYRKPSPFLSLFKGLWGMSKRIKKDQSFPVISARWQNVQISKGHLVQFNKICGLSDDAISMLYPYTLTFPIFMRILSEKKAPLSIFVVLNTRYKIIQNRSINPNELLNIQCKISDQRKLRKGMELDLTALLLSGDETIWQNTSTFYYRGNFGSENYSANPQALDKIPNAPEITNWFLPKGIGYRFSKIVGDNNGIHYASPYAKIFGFKRSFAQPILVLANSIRRLPSLNQNKTNILDVALKGPIYYDNKVSVRGFSSENDHRFDIYCDEEISRPGICCHLQCI